MQNIEGHINPSNHRQDYNPDLFLETNKTNSTTKFFQPILQ